MKLSKLFESVDDKQQYQKWLELINLSTSQLQKFLDSDLGAEAGLSRDEVSGTAMSRGRDSGRAILRMREKPFAEWNATDIQWMKKQNSFVSRMRAGAGSLIVDGKPTRRLTSLWVWGHEPHGLRPSDYQK